MELVDFSTCELSDRAYGGAAGRKEGIIYNGEFWIIKYPDNLKDRNLKNVSTSYCSNSISEYIGSHIFGLFGIPVHETILGMRNGKLVVACKDFTHGAEKLIEFREYKVSYVPHFLNKDGDITNGTGMDLKEALDCIKEHNVLSRIPGVIERFWDMFIIDALNGNPDRNNGNWGCIHNLISGTTALAPVYDNGSCLFQRFDDTQVFDALYNQDRFNELVFSVSSRFTVTGKLINPFKYLRACTDPLVQDRLHKIVKSISTSRVNRLLSDITPYNENTATLYNRLYTHRLQELIRISNEVDIHDPLSALKEVSECLT